MVGYLSSTHTTLSSILSKANRAGWPMDMAVTPSKLKARMHHLRSHLKNRQVETKKKKNLKF